MLIESRFNREVQKETEILHSRLRDIAQAVINDDQVSNFEQDLTSPRSRSPVRRPYQSNSRPSSRNASPFADATFSAVQAALNKRQLQVKIKQFFSLKINLFKIKIKKKFFFSDS